MAAILLRPQSVNSEAITRLSIWGQPYLYSAFFKPISGLGEGIVLYGSIGTAGRQIQEELDTVVKIGDRVGENRILNLRSGSPVYSQDSNLVITVPADVVAPKGARTSSGPMLTTQIFFFQVSQVIKISNNILMTWWCFMRSLVLKLKYSYKNDMIVYKHQLIVMQIWMSNVMCQG